MPARKPRKSREGLATPTGIDEADAPPPKGAEFDPQQVVEKLNVYCVNGKDCYLPMPLNGHAGSVAIWKESHLKRELRLLGVRTSKEEGKTYSQTDSVMQHIIRERRVEFAGELAGYPVGVHDVLGRKIAVTGTHRLIQPVAGDWPVLRALLHSRFFDGMIDQTPRFMAWIKQAVASLRAGERQPGHLLVLIGESDSGKSFIQEHIITPLLGGRAADPTSYLMGDSQFTGSLFGSEHLMMQELPSGLDGKSRSLLAENLKQLVVNESMSLRAMYQEAISVTPFRRVTLSMNDNVDRLRAFPSLTSDFSDKVLLLRLVSAPMPMPTKTLEDRKAFRETLQRELPAFMAELLAWDIPDEIRTGRNADRFGFDEWQHPSITASMFEQEPESVVLWVIDNSGLFVDGKPWGWAPSEALSDQLLDGPHGRKVVPLFKHSGACGRYLGLLKKRFPKRFECDHKNRGNFWMIHPQ